MAEPSNVKRAVFPTGEQKEFLEKVILKFPIADIARICGLSEHAVRDWRREKFSMPLDIVHTLAARAHIPIPRNILTRDIYAHTRKAGEAGMAAVTAIYGRIPRDEKYRKEQWSRWWESTGKFEKNPILESKPIRKPRLSGKPCLKLFG